MGVITVNSRVVYGHVGNAAATPALQALGVEAWPVDTVMLSNHPAYPTCRGGARPPEEVAALLAGLGERGLFPRTRAVTAGYLGRPENTAAILETVAAVRAARPDALFACDPIAGDAVEGFYVPPEVRGAIRDRLVPEADLVLPNLFELAWLTDHAPADIGDVGAIVAAARELAGRGRPKTVVVTSVPDGGEGIGALLVGAGSAHLAAVPRIETGIKGAGDLLAALLVGRWVLGVPPLDALASAVGGTAAVLRRAEGAGERELALHRGLDLLHAAAPAPLRRVG